MGDPFYDCHPAVNFLYFAMVITFSMCLMHPVCLVFSLVGAMWYTARLRGGRALRGYLRWIIPMMVMAALVNPAFVHQGVTLLAYLPSGNPLTLESILYGLAAACMLAAVAQAQRFWGRDTANGSLRQRTRNALKVFSIMVTWSLESAIDTADSMRSRGYGEPGRTAFSIYRFDDRDRGLLLWLLFCGVYLLAGTLARGMKFRYYPMLMGAQPQAITVSFFAVYLLLCLTPVGLSLVSGHRFRSLEKGGRTV